MLELVTKDPHAHQSILDELARTGARQILCQALQQEVEDYINQNKNELDENGHRLVVRNGKTKNRTLSMGVGQINLQAPRVNDKRDGHKFESIFLPKYIRKSPNIENLVPILYLKGLSTNDFKTALESILGEGAQGFSPGSIVSLFH